MKCIFQKKEIGPAKYIANAVNFSLVSYHITPDSIVVVKWLLHSGGESWKGNYILSLSSLNDHKKTALAPHPWLVEILVWRRGGYLVGNRHSFVLFYFNMLIKITVRPSYTTYRRAFVTKASSRTVPSQIPMTTCIWERTSLVFMIAHADVPEPDLYARSRLLFFDTGSLRQKLYMR